MQFDVGDREPTLQDHTTALRFLRNLTNHAVKLYLAECEHTIVLYVRKHWVKPDHVEMITSFSDVLSLLSTTLTGDKGSRYWANWAHFHHIYRVLWEDSLSNHNCARSFSYRYLNEVCQSKVCPTRSRKDLGPSDINGEFWRQLKSVTSDWAKPVVGNEPLQCGFIARLNIRRRNKYSDLLVDRVEAKLGIIFRIQDQRKRSLPCVHKEMIGKQCIWKLFKAPSNSQSPQEDHSRKRAMDDAGTAGSVGGGSLASLPPNKERRIDHCVDFLKKQFGGQVSKQDLMAIFNSLKSEIGGDSVVADIVRMEVSVRNVDTTGSVEFSSITTKTSSIASPTTSVNLLEDDGDDENTVISSPSPGQDVTVVPVAKEMPKTKLVFDDESSDDDNDNEHDEDGQNLTTIEELPAATNPTPPPAYINYPIQSFPRKKPPPLKLISMMTNRCTIW